MVIAQRLLVICLVTLAATSYGRAAETDAHRLLVLQATARLAAGLAEGNYCAGLELKPRIEATLRYLTAAPAAGDAVVGETIEILARTRYDTVPCDAPCPPPTAAAVVRLDAPYGPEATAKHTASLHQIVTQWLQRAESDPPVLSIAASRHSYDPLPRYLPGQPVAYLVHVGPSCHGAVLSLDRDFVLPSSFDGAGSFVPARDGLWTVHIERRDGLALSPLLYLDADTGLPSYYKEFWVSAEPVGLLGPGGVGPWARPSGEPGALP